MFECTEGKGFRVTFKNGYTVSVQFGKGNYCANRMVGDWGSPAPACVDAEVAVLDSKDNWKTRDFIPDAGDDVFGHMAPDDVADLMFRVSKA